MARTARAALSADDSQTNGLDNEPSGMDAGCSSSPTELADDFRTRAFHLMDDHPIAAAHLVLAAASIAPECAAEKEVADEFSFVIADFTQQLKILHHRAVVKRASQTGGAHHGA